MGFRVRTSYSCNTHPKHRQSTLAVPKAVSFSIIISVMRVVTNILILVAGVVVSGIAAAASVAVMAQAGALGACFGEGCGYAGLFLAFPLTWFVLFSLFLMAMLIWRRKPKRDY